MTGRAIRDRPDVKHPNGRPVLPNRPGARPDPFTAMAQHQRGIANPSVGRRPSARPSRWTDRPRSARLPTAPNGPFAVSAMVDMPASDPPADATAVAEKYRRALRRQSILAEFGALALQSDDLDALIEEAVRRAAEGVGVGHAALYQYDPAGHRLQVRSGIGWSDGVVGGRTLAADPTSPAGHALATGEPATADDLSEDDRFEAPDLLREHGIVALASVPIRMDGKVYGVLEVDSQRRRTFTSDGVSFLQGLANMLAAAIQRHRLEAAAQQRARRLQAMAEATRAITAASGVESTLQAITDQARAVIGAHLAATHEVADLAWSGAAIAVSLSDRYAHWRGYDEAPRGTGIYVEIGRTNRPMRLTQAELEAHPAWRGFDSSAGKHPPLRGLLGAPLVGSDGRNLGVIMVSDRCDGGDFTDEDQTVLVQLTRVAATAMERARADAALRESEQRLRATYEHAAVGIVEVDSSGRLLRVNEAFCRSLGYARDDLVGRSLAEISHPDDREHDLALLRRQVAGEIDDYAIAKRSVRSDGSIVWLAIASAPVRDAEGRLQYSVRVGQDITERRRAEEHQKLLVAELSHRVKNTLAAVQSIATQTFRDEGAAARATFLARLRALGQAHGLLSRTEWQGADLRDIVRLELAPHLRGAWDGRARIDGGPVRVVPRTALTLGMAIHELATNAAKYGALSSPTGRVDVAWAVREGEDRALTIDWVETGGPPVRPPTRKGFGSTLIERSIEHELDGAVDMTFAPNGLRCSIRVPLPSA